MKASMEKINAKNDFLKSCSKVAPKSIKSCFCNESCSKVAEVARKNKNVFGLMQIAQQK